MHKCGICQAILGGMVNACKCGKWTCSKCFIDGKCMQCSATEALPKQCGNCKQSFLEEFNKNGTITIRKCKCNAVCCAACSIKCSDCPKFKCCDCCSKSGAKCADCLEQDAARLEKIKAEAIEEYKLKRKRSKDDEYSAQGWADGAWDLW